jgi:hypothetical protein
MTSAPLGQTSTILLSASVRLMTAAEGGRNRGTVSGYRPHLEVLGLMTSCHIERADGQGRELPLGTTIACTLWPIWSALIRSRVHTGGTVYFYEGARCIGSALIEDVLDFDPAGPVTSIDQAAEYRAADFDHAAIGDRALEH